MEGACADHVVVCSASFRYIMDELVQAEVASGISSKRIIVAGFSQGGAVALMALRSEVQLGGIIGLSTYMPLRDEGLVSEANKATPVLLCHGEADKVVAYHFGQMTAQALEGLGMNVTWQTYAGLAHSVRSVVCFWVRGPPTSCLGVKIAELLCGCVCMESMHPSVRCGSAAFGMKRNYMMWRMTCSSNAMQACQEELEEVEVRGNAWCQ